MRGHPSFSRLRELLKSLAREGLDPARVSAAVFVGVFMGLVPIYGFQALAALGIAVLLKLNKPLTFAGTCISNPLFQPFLAVAAVELGNLVMNRPVVTTLSEIRRLDTGSFLQAWILGSVLLGLILATLGALATYLLVRRRNARGPLPE